MTNSPNHQDISKVSLPDQPCLELNCLNKYTLLKDDVAERIQYWAWDQEAACLNHSRPLVFSPSPCSKTSQCLVPQWNNNDNRSKGPTFCWFVQAENPQAVESIPLTTFCRNVTSVRNYLGGWVVQVLHLFISRESDLDFLWEKISIGKRKHKLRIYLWWSSCTL